MPEDTATTVDGRRARRTRNRAAVVDALFELLQEGIAPPSVEQIAVRAGVSVSSLFRYFDGLDDLQHQTIDAYFTRFAPLLTVPGLGEGPLLERITRMIDARLDLYSTVAPIARLARSRAYDHPRVAQSLVDARAVFTAQTRAHFVPELQATSRSHADDIVGLIDTLTAFESWDLLTAGQGRSTTQVRRSWIAGVHAILAAA